MASDQESTHRSFTKSELEAILQVLNAKIMAEGQEGQLEISPAHAGTPAHVKISVDRIDYKKKPVSIPDQIEQLKSVAASILRPLGLANDSTLSQINAIDPGKITNTPISLGLGLTLQKSGGVFNLQFIPGLNATEIKTRFKGNVSDQEPEKNTGHKIENSVWLNTEEGVRFKETLTPYLHSLSGNEVDLNIADNRITIRFSRYVTVDHLKTVINGLSQLGLGEVPSPSALQISLESFVTGHSNDVPLSPHMELKRPRKDAHITLNLEQASWSKLAEAMAEVPTAKLKERVNPFSTIKKETPIKPAALRVQELKKAEQWVTNYLASRYSNEFTFTQLSLTPQMPLGTNSETTYKLELNLNKKQAADYLERFELTDKKEGVIKLYQERLLDFSQALLGKEDPLLKVIPNPQLQNTQQWQAALNDTNPSLSLGTISLRIGPERFKKYLLEHDNGFLEKNADGSNSGYRFAVALGEIQVLADPIKRGDYGIRRIAGEMGKSIKPMLESRPLWSPSETGLQIAKTMMDKTVEPPPIQRPAPVVIGKNAPDSTDKSPIAPARADDEQAPAPKTIAKEPKPAIAEVPENLPPEEVPATIEKRDLPQHNNAANADNTDTSVLNTASEDKIRQPDAEPTTVKQPILPLQDSTASLSMPPRPEIDWAKEDRIQEELVALESQVRNSVLGQIENQRIGSYPIKSLNVNVGITKTDDDIFYFSIDISPNTKKSEAYSDYIKKRSKADFVDELAKICKSHFPPSAKKIITDDNHIRVEYAMAQEQLEQIVPLHEVIRQEKKRAENDYSASRNSWNSIAEHVAKARQSLQDEKIGKWEEETEIWHQLVKESAPPLPVPSASPIAPTQFAGDITPPADLGEVAALEKTDTGETNSPQAQEISGLDLLKSHFQEVLQKHLVSNSISIPALDIPEVSAVKIEQLEKGQLDLVMRHELELVLVKKEFQPVRKTLTGLFNDYRLEQLKNLVELPAGRSIGKEDVQPIVQAIFNYNGYNLKKLRARAYVEEGVLRPFYQGELSAVTKDDFSKILNVMHVTENLTFSFPESNEEAAHLMENACRALTELRDNQLKNIKSGKQPPPPEGADKKKIEQKKPEDAHVTAAPPAPAKNIPSTQVSKVAPVAGALATQTPTRKVEKAATSGRVGHPAKPKPILPSVKSSQQILDELIANDRAGPGEIMQAFMDHRNYSIKYVHENANFLDTDKIKSFLKGSLPLEDQPTRINLDTVTRDSFNRIVRLVDIPEVKQIIIDRFNTHKLMRLNETITPPEGGELGPQNIQKIFNAYFDYTGRFISDFYREEGSNYTVMQSFMDGDLTEKYGPVAERHDIFKRHIAGLTIQSPSMSPDQKATLQSTPETEKVLKDVRDAVTAICKRAQTKEKDDIATEKEAVLLKALFPKEEKNSKAQKPLDHTDVANIMAAYFNYSDSAKYKFERAAHVRTDVMVHFLTGEFNQISDEQAKKIIEAIAAPPGATPEVELLIGNVRTLLTNIHVTYQKKQSAKEENKSQKTLRKAIDARDPEAIVDAYFDLMDMNKTQFKNKSKVATYILTRFVDGSLKEIAQSSWDKILQHIDPPAGNTDKQITDLVNLTRNTLNVLYNDAQKTVGEHAKLEAQPALENALTPRATSFDKSDAPVILEAYFAYTGTYKNQLSSDTRAQASLMNGDLENISDYSWEIIKSNIVSPYSVHDKTAEELTDRTRSTLDALRKQLQERALKTARATLEKAITPGDQKSLSKNDIADIFTTYFAYTGTAYTNIMNSSVAKSLFAGQLDTVESSTWQSILDKLQAPNDTPEAIDIIAKTKAALNEIRKFERDNSKKHHIANAENETIGQLLAGYLRYADKEIGAFSQESGVGRVNIGNLINHPHHILSMTPMLVFKVFNAVNDVDFQKALRGNYQRLLSGHEYTNLLDKKSASEDKHITDQGSGRI